MRVIKGVPEKQAGWQTEEGSGGDWEKHQDSPGIKEKVKGHGRQFREPLDQRRIRRRGEGPKTQRCKRGGGNYKKKKTL